MPYFRLLRRRRLGLRPRTPTLSPREDGEERDRGARRGTNVAAPASISSEGGVSFVATFEDGPKNGPRRRAFSAASVPERMWFAPERRVVDRKAGTHDGWMLVGIAPRREPAEPWPGEIEFLLGPARSHVNH